MMQSARHRLREHSNALPQSMTGFRSTDRNQHGGRIRDSRTQTTVRSTAVVMFDPRLQDRSQVCLGQRNHQSRHSLRIVPITRSQIEFAFGIRTVIWQTIMGFDSLGSAWGPQTGPEGPGVMRYPTKTSWGWNSSYAANVTAPTLITRITATGRCSKSRLRAIGSDFRCRLKPCGQTSQIAGRKRRRVLGQTAFRLRPASDARCAD